MSSEGMKWPPTQHQQLSNCQWHTSGKSCMWRAVCMVRGVNIFLKLPSNPPGSTHLCDGFYNHRDVTFVGRPFPVHQADEHFARLRAWGLTFVRFLVPWEALEHGGPGIYDEEFIDHLREILKKAPRYGIKCFVDPHQDTWSRYSGGSGAPGWTFEVAGLDITKFKQTGAAFLQQLEGESGANLRTSAYWPTNYTKLASATMFALFFGGNIFAPKALYKGETVQDFLQGHFLRCFQHLARYCTSLRYIDLEAVCGYEVINEPHFGYIGLESLYKWDPVKNLMFGESPNALQSFAIGHGIPTEVEVWAKSWPWPTRKVGKKVINSEKQSVWINGEECIWKRHGVWGLDESGKPVVLRPNYFTTHPKDGSPVDFSRHCYGPFILKFAKALQEVVPEAMIFFEPIPNEQPPILREQNVKHFVYAPHWYDLKSLFTKTFDGIVTHDVQGLSSGTKNVISATYFGLAGAIENYTGQVRNIVRSGLDRVGQMPVVVGECGIPYDINEKQAFESGDYTHHTNFLDAVINAMEANLVSFTLWNYNAANDNDFGDHWNAEDFSIYSPKPKRKLQTSSATKAGQSLPSPTTPFEITAACFEGHPDHHHHIGGRALDAIVRPYAAKVAGVPLISRFDLRKLEYRLEFKTLPITGRPGAEDRFATEIFVPNFHYGDVKELVVKRSDGRWSYKPENQTLTWDASSKEVVHWITIGVPASKKLEWSGLMTFWPWILAILFIVVTLSFWAFGFGGI
ncbi:glycoside hydrolase superfamily [Cladochytrium replicatum]|nr:glycoside hydrolase superfamily [Cladochytrium replicatum]